jgi:hypothetical protein
LPQGCSLQLEPPKIEGPTFYGAIYSLEENKTTDQDRKKAPDSEAGLDQSKM